MSKNTSIVLDTYFERFIQNSLNSGRYKNTSEVIRAALRLLEEEESKSIALRKAIQEGIESGHDESFNAATHLKNLKKNKKQYG